MSMSLEGEEGGLTDARAPSTDEDVTAGSDSVSSFNDTSFGCARAEPQAFAPMACTVKPDTSRGKESTGASHLRRHTFDSGQLSVMEQVLLAEALDRGPEAITRSWQLVLDKLPADVDRTVRFQEPSDLTSVDLSVLIVEDQAFQQQVPTQWRAPAHSE